MRLGTDVMPIYESDEPQSDTFPRTQRCLICMRVLTDEQAEVDFVCPGCAEDLDSD